jgi:hypothetical protein
MTHSGPGPKNPRPAATIGARNAGLAAQFCGRSIGTPLITHSER